MNKEFKEIILEDIKVLCVSVVGVQNSSKAFAKLEETIGSLKGRKFYGALTGDPKSGIYRACVKVNGGQNEGSIGLKPWIIPGGLYLKATLNDWFGKEEQIGETFSKMSEVASMDETRPYIEFYRSMKEMVLMMPLAH